MKSTEYLSEPVIVVLYPYLQQYAPFSSRVAIFERRSFIDVLDGLMYHESMREEHALLRDTVEPVNLFSIKLRIPLCAHPHPPTAN